MSNDKMFEIANFFLEKNIEDHSDYVRKYQEMLVKAKEIRTNANVKSKQHQVEKQNLQSQDCIKKLKEFRLEQSKKDGVKPYYIFTDAQMQDVVDLLPRTKEELQKISGFGKVKVEKYGEEILNILADFQ